LEFDHPLHSVVPALFERAGNQAIAGVGLLIAAFCQVSIVAGPLDPSVPLRRNRGVARFQIGQRFECKFDCQRRNGGQQTRSDGVIQRLCRQRHAVAKRRCVPTSRVAVIARVKTAVTGIACTQTPPANATKQHALQQAETLASRPSENLAVGPVRREATAIGEELIPGDVTRMVVRNNNTPLILWHLARLSTDLASGADLLARLIPTKHVSAGVRWIRKNADHPRMGQPTPDEFAIPHTAVRSTRKEKTDLVEALNHSVGTVLLLEQREDRPDGTLHFLVGIENDLIVVKYQTNWQWKTQ